MNTENYKEIFLNLKEKLEQIAALPNAYNCGRDFVGIDFDRVFIYYKTETYCSGCGTDEYSLDITWDEINEPLDYFRAKFQKEFEVREKEQIEREAKIIKQEENRERAKYLELQKKYGTI